MRVGHFVGHLRWHNTRTSSRIRWHSLPEASGVILALLGAILGYLGATLGHLRATLGLLGALLGAILGTFGTCATVIWARRDAPQGARVAQSTRSDTEWDHSVVKRIRFTSLRFDYPTFGFPQVTSGAASGLDSKRFCVPFDSMCGTYLLLP